jgi:RecA/RadA recombinase
MEIPPDPAALFLADPRTSYSVHVSRVLTGLPKLAEPESLAVLPARRGRPAGQLVTSPACLPIIPMPLMDSFLFCKGGLPEAPGIIEVWGEGGVGKSQLVATMAVAAAHGCAAQAAVAGVAATPNVLFLTTKPDGLGSRIAQIAAAAGPGISDRIGVRPVEHVNDLFDTLTNTVQALLDGPNGDNIVMVVVDSVADLFRLEYDPLVHGPERAADMNVIAATMRDMSSRYGLAFVVTNQATASMSKHPSDPSSVAALGRAWSHCVDWRIGLRRQRETGAARTLHVERSPFRPQSWQTVYITSQGMSTHSEQTHTDALPPPAPPQGDAWPQQATATDQG